MAISTQMCPHCDNFDVVDYGIQSDGGDTQDMIVHRWYCPRCDETYDEGHVVRESRMGMLQTVDRRIEQAQRRAEHSGSQMKRVWLESISQWQRMRDYINAMPDDEDDDVLKQAYMWTLHDGTDDGKRD